MFKPLLSGSSISIVLATAAEAELSIFSSIERAHIWQTMSALGAIGDWINYPFQSLSLAQMQKSFPKAGKYA